MLKTIDKFKPSKEIKLKSLKKNQIFYGNDPIYHHAMIDNKVNNTIINHHSKEKSNIIIIEYLDKSVQTTIICNDLKSFSKNGQKFFGMDFYEALDRKSISKTNITKNVTQTNSPLIKAKKQNIPNFDIEIIGIPFTEKKPCIY